MSEAMKKPGFKSVKKRKPKKQKLDRIDVRCLQIRNYNKKYCTDYSYGQFDAMIRLKKIRWCGGEWEPVATGEKVQKSKSTTAKRKTKAAAK